MKPLPINRIIGLFCLLHTSVYAQRSDFVFFTDKVQSTYSVSTPTAFLSQRAIDRRVAQNIPITSHDFPVNAWYVDSLTARGAQVWYTSRWLNGALIRNATDSLIQVLNTLPFVQSTSRTRRISVRYPEPQPAAVAPPTARTSSVQTIQYGASLNQNNMLGVPTMHALNYAGQGKLIAIFDAGFPGVPTAACFDSIRQRNGIVATYDFVANNGFVYGFHPHGTNVFGTLAGYLPGALIGPAYGAQFILCRTEDASTEFRVEEANWLLAAEFADSIGVDIINTSLGYYTFDNPSMDYTPSDMNGNTTWITRAADMAASKGILCVASAGNNGSDPNWRVITAPADGDSVLAVGAVTHDSLQVGFSSVGLSSTGRIKPDVTAQGESTIVALSNGAAVPSSGTSFSGPLVAGLAAGFWQANPSLTAQQVLVHLRNSGHKANAPDSLMGYGIPNFGRAMALAGNPLLIPQETEKLILKGNLVRPTDLLTFELTGVNAGEQMKVQVVDMTGRILIRMNDSYNGGTHAIDLTQASMADGHYILVVETSRIRGKARFAVR